MSSTARPDIQRIARDRRLRRQVTAQFAAIVAERFPPFAARGHLPPRLTLRLMRTRWGSLSVQRRRPRLARWLRRA
jgi:hypothetical protein